MKTLAAKKSDRRSGRSSMSAHPSSGNDFEDVGIPNSADALAKAELAAQIALTIRSRGLTQVRAAGLLGVNQADVSDLVRGKLKGFSTERLVRFLNALGRDVDIVVHKGRRTQTPGKLSVLLASAKRRLTAARG